MTDHHPWLDELVRRLGEHEVKGPKHNPLIVEWGRAAGIGWWNNDEDAWCAVAVNGVLAKTGFAGTRSALARSFLTWGVKLDQPVPGAIVVFPRGPNPAYGHVGIVEHVDRGTITIVNGNVSDMVKRSERRISEILPGGIRWPADAAPPAKVNVEGLRPPQLGDRILRYGVAGPDVEAWQRRLSRMGHGRFDATGWFGRKTRSRTLEFQAARRLLVDGQVGPATLAESLTVLDEIARRQPPQESAATVSVTGSTPPMETGAVAPNEPGSGRSAPEGSCGPRAPSTGRIATGVIAAALLAGVAGTLLKGNGN